MRQSIILLPSTQGQVSVTGAAIKAAGYYGSGISSYTAAMYLSNFSGRIYIEASLAQDAFSSEADWFPVKLGTNTNYLEYLPQTPDGNGLTGITQIVPINFKGNYVWLRARLDRSTLANPGTTVYGSIEQILVNF